MKLRGLGGLLVIVVLAVAAACGEDDEASQEETVDNLCGSLVEAGEALAGFVSLDPATATKEDVQNVVDEAQSAMDDARDAAQDLDEANTDALESSFDELRTAVEDLPDDTTLEEGRALLHHRLSRSRMR